MSGYCNITQPDAVFRAMSGMFSLYTLMVVEIGVLVNELSGFVKRFKLMSYSRNVMAGLRPCLFGGSPPASLLSVSLLCRLIQFFI